MLLSITTTLHSTLPNAILLPTNIHCHQLNVFVHKLSTNACSILLLQSLYSPTTLTLSTKTYAKSWRSGVRTSWKAVAGWPPSGNFLTKQALVEKHQATKSSTSKVSKQLQVTAQTVQLRMHSHVVSLMRRERNVVVIDKIDLQQREHEVFYILQSVLLHCSILLSRFIL